MISNYSINQLDGQPLNWEQFKGKKLMIVNVASECGLTPQYELLQELYEMFNDRNFTILGVPCNDFGAQEPGSAEEISYFCSKNYGVTFPLTEKISVLNDTKHPLYNYLTSTTGEEVSWNFQKFLVNENGEVEKVFSPQTLPNDLEIVNWIYGEH